jgi:hypothetical protein
VHVRQNAPFVLKNAAEGRDLCEKCEKLGAEVTRYRRLAKRIKDETALAQLYALITRLEAELDALHPMPQNQGSASVGKSKRAKKALL